MLSSIFKSKPKAYNKSGGHSQTLFPENAKESFFIYCFFQIEFKFSSSKSLKKVCIFCEELLSFILLKHEETDVIMIKNSDEINIFLKKSIIII
jgi:hypothetical protein